MEKLTSESNDQKEVKKLKRCEQKTYKNSSHIVGTFEILQSLLKDQVLCDIGIETDDGTIVFGHKVVLISVSTYFRNIFTGSNERNINRINVRELDSTVLQLLMNYIYTGEIIITEGNVKVLLLAANFLQLDYVKNVCVEFLQTQLDASNCLGIKAFADLNNCMELSKSSQTYIKDRFLEVVNHDEFLSLSSVEVIKLISCNDIFVQLEEKVFECVIHWVKYELDSRKYFLPELMEHVRLPLISKQYLLENVVDEPLLKTSPKCKDYIIEALQFHLLKYLKPYSQTIRSTPRQSIGFQKVILMFYWSLEKYGVVYWYDNIWHPAPIMNNNVGISFLTVVKDQFVLAVSGFCFESKCQSIEMLDVSLKSPSWIPMMGMLVSRKFFGVGSSDNCVYVIGGFNEENSRILNSVEVFDFNTNKWQMVTSMSTGRCYHSVGVLNNRLYVIGGFDGQNYLKSVECYDPSLDTWTPVAALSKYRSSCGVGVLDGVLYAIGGNNNQLVFLKSVEAYTPSSGVWTTVADMHFCRSLCGVVVSNGLLHVIGGRNNEGNLNSIEIYNPKTNTWSLKTLSKDIGLICSGVVVNRPSGFKIYND